MNRGGLIGAAAVFVFVFPLMWWFNPEVRSEGYVGAAFAAAMAIMISLLGFCAGFIIVRNAAWPRD